MQNEVLKRKKLRLLDFDYNTPGAYFITICTHNRNNILSKIFVVGGDVPDAPSSSELLPFGKIAEKYINQLSNFYADIKVDKYVIMPNHIHIMLFVTDNSDSIHSNTKQHSAVSRFISTFKRFCNKEYGCNIWQRGFNDHIIRNQTDYEKHLKYIDENVIKWTLDELYTNEDM